MHVIPYIRPLGQSFWVFVPRNLDTNRIATHLVKVGISRGSTVEKLPPQQLAVQREWRIGALDLLVQVRQLMVEQSSTQAAEAQVRRQTRLTGQK